MDLRAERRDRGDVAVLALHGDVDLNAAPSLRLALMEAIDARKRVVVDLEGVDFIDSAGLGVLLGGLERARGADRELVLVATGRNVLKVLELTGLTRVFELHASLAGALDG
jgi:anti-sigma B factor antagonist